MGIWILAIAYLGFLHFMSAPLMPFLLVCLVFAVATSLNIPEK